MFLCNIVFIMFKFVDIGKGLDGRRVRGRESESESESVILTT